jgi:hypothetical protein
MSHSNANKFLKGFTLMGFILLITSFVVFKSGLFLKGYTSNATPILIHSFEVDSPVHPTQPDTFLLHVYRNSVNQQLSKEFQIMTSSKSMVIMSPLEAMYMDALFKIRQSIGLSPRDSLRDMIKSKIESETNPK